MLAVVLVHNSQKNADKYVHADNDENDKKQTGPGIVVICRHPVQKNTNKNKAITNFIFSGLNTLTVLWLFWHKVLWKLDLSPNFNLGLFHRLNFWTSHSRFIAYLERRQLGNRPQLLKVLFCLQLVVLFVEYEQIKLEDDDEDATELQSARRMMGKRFATCSDACEYFRSFFLLAK